MRGQSASRETATAQRIKGQFGAMRLVNRQRRIEKFLDKIMQLKAELLVENLEPTLLEKMTAIAIPPEVVAVMRDDRLRSYRISIDTEESSAIDSAMDQKNRTEFLTATVQFLQSVGPLVSSGALGFDQAKQMLLFAARAFPGARELEESLEAIQPPQPQANPADKLVEVEAAKVQAQTAQAQTDAQVKIARLDLDRQKAQDDLAIKKEKLEIDAAKIVTG
jgi:Lon protease-like protein